MWCSARIILRRRAAITIGYFKDRMVRSDGARSGPSQGMPRAARLGVEWSRRTRRERSKYQELHYLIPPPEVGSRCSSNNLVFDLTGYDITV